MDISQYIDDNELVLLIKNLLKNLNTEGMIIMSFVQPKELWKLTDADISEQYLSDIVDIIIPTKKMYYRNTDTLEKIIFKVSTQKLSIKYIFDSREIIPIAIMHKIG
jgi:uncharacterized protein YkuJ